MNILITSLLHDNTNIKSILDKKVIKRYTNLIRAKNFLQHCIHKYEISYLECTGRLDAISNGINIMIDNIESMFIMSSDKTDIININLDEIYKIIPSIKSMHVANYDTLTTDEKKYLINTYYRVAPMQDIETSEIKLVQNYKQIHLIDSNIRPILKQLKKDNRLIDEAFYASLRSILAYRQSDISPIRKLTHILETIIFHEDQIKIISSDTHMLHNLESNNTGKFKIANRVVNTSNLSKQEDILDFSFTRYIDNCKKRESECLKRVCESKESSIIAEDNNIIINNAQDRTYKTFAMKRKIITDATGNTKIVEFADKYHHPLSTIMTVLSKVITPITTLLENHTALYIPSDYNDIFIDYLVGLIVTDHAILKTTNFNIDGRKVAKIVRDDSNLYNIHKMYTASSNTLVFLYDFFASHTSCIKYVDKYIEKDAIEIIKADTIKLYSSSSKNTSINMELLSKLNHICNLDNSSEILTNILNQLANTNLVFGSYIRDAFLLDCKTMISINDNLSGEFCIMTDEEQDVISRDETNSLSHILMTAKISKHIREELLNGVTLGNIGYIRRLSPIYSNEHASLLIDYIKKFKGFCEQGESNCFIKSLKSKTEIVKLEQSIRNIDDTYTMRIEAATKTINKFAGGKNKKGREAEKDLAKATEYRKISTEFLNIIQQPNRSAKFSELNKLLQQLEEVGNNIFTISRYNSKRSHLKELVANSEDIRAESQELEDLYVERLFRLYSTDVYYKPKEDHNRPYARPGKVLGTHTILNPDMEYLLNTFNVISDSLIKCAAGDRSDCMVFTIENSNAVLADIREINSERFVKMQEGLKTTKDYIVPDIIFDAYSSKDTLSNQSVAASTINWLYSNDPVMLPIKYNTTNGRCNNYMTYLSSEQRSCFKYTNGDAVYSVDAKNCQPKILLDIATILNLEVEKDIRNAINGVNEAGLYDLLVDCVSRYNSQLQSRISTNMEDAIANRGLIRSIEEIGNKDISHKKDEYGYEYADDANDVKIYNYPGKNWISRTDKHAAVKREVMRLLFGYTGSVESTILYIILKQHYPKFINALDTIRRLVENESTSNSLFNTLLMKLPYYDAPAENLAVLMQRFESAIWTKCYDEGFMGIHDAVLCREAEVEYVKSFICENHMKLLGSSPPLVVKRISRIIV